MQHTRIVISLSRLLVALAVIASMIAVGEHNLGHGFAAVPTGSFTGNSCSWDGTKKDYKYTISAKWVDTDAGTDPANAYLGSSSSKGNYGGAGSSTASDALDNTSHNGPSYTWTFYRSYLTDSKWPVKLWVHDIGNTTTPWHQAASANRPACANPTASLKVSATSATTNSNVTLSWSSSNASGCTASGSWSGNLGISSSGQSVNVGSTAGTRTYSLKCSNANASSALTSVAVTVVSPPPPASGGGGGSGGTGGSSGTGSNSSNRSSSQTGNSSPSAPPAAPTADSNATVRAGTISAVLDVPAGNATTINVTYNASGEDPITTADQQVSSDSASIEIDNLHPQTQYIYQIIRTNSAGTAATSPSATFTTKGYSVTLRFNDAKGKPIGGITGTIDDDSSTKTKSDSHGWLTFTDLADGTHTVRYVYNGKTHTSQFDTSTAPVPSDPSNIVNLTNTVDVSKLDTSGARQAQRSSAGVLWGVLAAAVLGFLFFFGVRWRRRHQALATLSAPIITGANDALDQHMPNAFAASPAPQSPQQPLPEHAGQSLRDMVVESIQTQGLPTSGPIPTVPGHPGISQVPVDAPLHAFENPSSYPAPITTTPPPVAPPLVPNEPLPTVTPLQQPYEAPPPQTPDEPGSTTLQIPH